MIFPIYMERVYYSPKVKYFQVSKMILNGGAERLISLVFGTEIMEGAFGKMDLHVQN